MFFFILLQFISPPTEEGEFLQLIVKIETVLNWDDINWYKPGKTAQNFYSTQKNNEESKKRELINPLVTNCLDILKEENRVKERKLNEYKKKLKLDLMKKKNKNLDAEKANPLQVSKYPVEKNIYDLHSKLNQIGKENENSIDYSLMNYAGYNCIPQSTENKKYFLDAFKKVVLTQEEKKKKIRAINKYKKVDQWIEFRYYHPGTFVSYIFYINFL